MANFVGNFPPQVVHAAEIAEHIMASPSSVREFLSRFLGLENQEASRGAWKVEVCGDGVL